MSRKFKVYASSKGSVEDMLMAFEDRLDELEDSGFVDSATDLIQASYSDKPEMFVDYEAFLENYADYYDEDDLDAELFAVEDEIRSYGENPHNCPVYWREDYEKPIVELDGRYYYADFRGTEARLTDVSLIEDLSSLGLPSEVDSCDAIMSDVEEKTGCYCIEDTFGAPQAGVDRKYFDTFDEAQDYIFANPDVEDRINEGYAILKEC